MSRPKTEYLHCRFSAGEGGVANDVFIEGAFIPRVERFIYLGSIIQKNGEIDEDVNQRRKIGWQKWKKDSGVLCNKKISLKLNERAYRIVVGPTLLYRVECWPIKRSHIQNTRVTEIRVIRWTCSCTRLDKIINEVIKGKIRVTSIENKIRKVRLHWFGHINRRRMDAPTGRYEKIDRPDYRRSGGRPKKSWSEFIRHDLKNL